MALLVEELLEDGLVLELLREKCSHELPADGTSCSATANAREKVKQWQCAWKVFEEIHLQGLQANVIMHIAAISACVKGKP